MPLVPVWPLWRTYWFPVVVCRKLAGMAGNIGGHSGAAIPRSVGIDAARIIGLVAIVVGHVWTDDSVARWLYPWHVPVFFIVTGYLWSDRRSLREEVAQRSRSLLLPYVSWLLLILAVLEARALVVDGVPDRGSAMGAALGGSYAVRPFTTFWFVTTLFVAVLLLKLLRRTPTVVQILVPVLALGLGYAAGPELARVPLGIGLAVPCLFYLAAGLALRRVESRIPRPGVAAAALVGIPLVLIAAGDMEYMNIKGGQMGEVGIGALVAVMAGWGLILGLQQLCGGIGDTAFGRATVAVGSSALVLVLVHPAVLWVLRTPETGRWSDLVLAVLVPVAVALVLVRTPLAAALVGRGSAIGRSARQPAPSRLQTPAKGA